jgi:undecaprenyl-diphosphatase
MTLLQAIAFGLVQGLGEFLPISSSAHLTILPWVTGWEDPGLAVDVALHVGTLLALVLYFRKDLASLARAFVDSVREREIGWYHERRLAWLVLLGSVPGAAIGFLLEHKAEDTLRAPWIVALAMILLGAALYVADRAGARSRHLGTITPRDALMIGLAQACAIVPGVSRSGSTITAGRLLGLDREAAARFSFLLAAPITAGAALVKVPKLVSAGGITPTLALAVAVSAVSGYLAIDVLLRFVRARSYLPFVVYRVLFGAAVLALFVARR